MAGKFGHGGKERELAVLADRQHGVAGRQQVLALGFGPRAIERRVRMGRLHRLHRGVYAVGRKRVGRRGHWLAAVLACGEGAVLSHLSAAGLWGLVRPRTSPVDVTSSRSHSGRAGIRLHEGKLRPNEQTTRDEIPVTTVARTLFDLAEVVDEPRLEHAWEEADRLNRLQLSTVEQVCEQGYGRRALRPIHRLLAEARAVTATRSPLEDRFLAFCRHYRIPAPETNTHVLGHEVDALWPVARLVAELDSWEFHGHRSAFERDRARDPKFLLAGYRTIRITHRRLDREADELATEILGLLRLGSKPGNR